MYFLLLLLALFAAVVTSQLSQDCLDATEALSANQFCSEVVIQLKQINNEELTNFCLSCRDLINRLSVNCADGKYNTATLKDRVHLMCTTNMDGSCTQLFESPQFLNINNAFDPSGECKSLGNGEQSGACSQNCHMLLQDFVNVGGCCALEILEYTSRLHQGKFDITADQLLLRCSINVTHVTSCQVIDSGGKKVKAYSYLLLFAVVIATMF